MRGGLHGRSFGEPHKLNRHETPRKSFDSALLTVLPAREDPAVSGRLIRYALMAVLLPHALPATVASSPVKIEAALASGEALTTGERPEAALLLLRPLVGEGHRTPELLFETGRAALATSVQDHIAEDRRKVLLDEAVMLLDESLQLRPAHTQTRYLLARALWFLGQDDLARWHFERVLAARPPPDIAAWIRSNFAPRAESRRWSGYIGAAIAFSDNIDATSDSTHIWMDTWGKGRRPFLRDAGELPQSGPGLSIWSGLAYESPLASRLSLHAGIDAVLRDHAGRRFDDAWVGVHLGPRWKIDADTDVSLFVEAERQWNSGRIGRSSVGLSLEAGYSPTGMLDLHANLGWRRDVWPRSGSGPDDDPDTCIDEAGEEPMDPVDEFDACIDDAPTTRDGPAGHFALTAAWMATSELQLRTTLGYEWEHPKAHAWRNAAMWGRIGAILVLPEGFLVDVSTELRRTRYEDSGWREGPHFTADRKRRIDRTRTVRASLSNSRLAIDGFAPELAFVHVANATNAQARDYRRNSLEFSFTRHF